MSGPSGSGRVVLAEEEAAGVEVEGSGGGGEVVEGGDCSGLCIGPFPYVR